MLNESGERVELELLGELRPGEEKVLAEVSNRCGLGRAPVIKGPVPHEMITSWLLTLDCFVMPSVSEGCPNILMEALAAGLPCVATRTGAAEDLILDGVSGRLTDWGDSGALSEAVREIMENPEKALSMGRAARSRMELFSAQRERDAWKDLYTGLLENGPGRGKA
jgi:glycosyltransferase involved in cell wall biosynthesis